MVKSNDWLTKTILIAGYTLALGLGYMGFDSIKSSINRIEANAQENDRMQSALITKTTESINKLCLQVNQNTRDLLLNYETRMNVYNKQNRKSVE